MDKTSLRRLLDRVLIHQPPTGPVARGPLGAGIKLRGCRLGGAGGSAVVAAVVVFAIPGITGAGRRRLRRIA